MQRAIRALTAEDRTRVLNTVVSLGTKIRGFDRPIGDYDRQYTWEEFPCVIVRIPDANGTELFDVTVSRDTGGSETVNTLGAIVDPIMAHLSTVGASLRVTGDYTASVQKDKQTVRVAGRVFNRDNVLKVAALLEAEPPRPVVNLPLNDATVAQVSACRTFVQVECQRVTRENVLKLAALLK